MLELVCPAVGLVGLGDLWRGSRTAGWTWMGFSGFLFLMIVLAFVQLLITGALSIAGTIALFGSLYVLIWIVHASIAVQHLGIAAGTVPKTIARTLLVVTAIAFPPSFLMVATGYDPSWGVSSHWMLAIPTAIAVVPIYLGVELLLLQSGAYTTRRRLGSSLLALFSPAVGLQGVEPMLIGRRRTVGLASLIAGLLFVFLAVWQLLTAHWHESILHRVILMTSIYGYTALWVWSLVDRLDGNRSDDETDAPEVAGVVSG